MITAERTKVMDTPEQHVLSTLRPGDMLRFVLSTGARGKLYFFIEGVPAANGDGMLAERLSLTLKALYDAGFEFTEGVATLPSRRKASRKRPMPHMVEIRPRPLHHGGLSEGVLGFSKEHLQQENSLTLPSFHAFSETRFFSSVANAMVQANGIQRFELEFTRFELPTDCVKPLERAFSIHTMSGVTGREHVSPQKAFLTLWLQHRSGWKLRTRAWTAHRPPIAALEMIGHDIFSCDCDVHSTKSREPVKLGNTLQNCYPRGWRFPTMFPTPDVFSKLSVSRLHNPNLPDLPETGFQIGVADGQAVRLPEDSRDRHTCIFGGTGTGKTTLLERMIIEDMRCGIGVIAIDAHGDSHAKLVQAVPASRKGDLLVIDPTREDCRPGLNILDIPKGALRKRNAALLIGELIQCFREMWNLPDAFGPMFEVYFRNAIQLLTLRTGEPLTVESFDRVFTDKQFRADLIAECSDQPTVSFWKNIAEKVTGDASLANVTPYITSKMSPLTQGAFLSLILNQPRDEVRFSDRINRSPIILINLNKGMLGVHESRILGVILMTQIMSAGLKRSLMRPDERRPVSIYVDEFQNFVSDNMASMLSEARKFGLRLTLANQNLAQLKANAGRQDLLETVLGNVGTMIFFRLGAPDADRLRLFIEPFTRQEMQNLPNFHALVRILTAEGPVRPLIMQTLKSSI